MNNKAHVGYIIPIVNSDILNIKNFDSTLNSFREQVTPSRIALWQRFYTCELRVVIHIEKYIIVKNKKGSTGKSMYKNQNHDWITSYYVLLSSYLLHN